MRPLITYTVLRLALFVAAMAALYPVARGLLNIVLAAVISLLLSYLLLRRPREALSRELAGRVARRTPAPGQSGGILGLDDGAQLEDAELDARGTAAGPAPAAPRPDPNPDADSSPDADSNPDPDLDRRAERDGPGPG